MALIKGQSPTTTTEPGQVNPMVVLSGPNLDQFMRPIASPVAKPTGKVLQIDQMNNFQYQPLGEPNTTAKGTFILYDKTGGTALFKYDPKTGVITILGSFVANNVNSGTYSNVVFSGTNTLTGTIAQGVFSGNLMSGGTINSVYQTGGTLGATGIGTYVKTVDYVGSVTTYGTMKFNNGLLLSIT